MKNNIIILLSIFIALSLNTNAQLINCNPDSEGEPWWAGGDIPLTEEEWDAIPNARIRSNRVANLC